LILTKFLFSGDKKDSGDDIDPLLDEAAGDLSVNLEIAIKGKGKINKQKL